MAKFQCSNNAGHKFDSMTSDGFCPNCSGVGFLVPLEDDKATMAGPISEKAIPDAGLCLLLLDVSYSMNGPAFAGNPAPRYRLVAGSAASGIFDLQNITKKDRAYVGCILFGTTTKVLFLKTVSDIFNEYTDTQKFAAWLGDEMAAAMEELGSGTNISGALKFAREIYEDAVADDGSFEKIGGPSNIKLDTHSFLKKNDTTVMAQNIRVLIYTDAEEGGDEGGNIVNPFKKDEIDVLMGAFLGNPEDSYATKLRNELSNCPVHGVRQFFIINQPSHYQTLKKLFRMASGYSGFCLHCIADANKS